MSGDPTEPDMTWSAAISLARGGPTRCPFATPFQCPRHFESRRTLKYYGSTPIDVSEEAALEEYWAKSPLRPVSAEEAPAVVGGEKGKSLFNFCPEVLFDRFRVFVSGLTDYYGSEERDGAHERLRRQGVPPSSWRWEWQQAKPMHYSECPLYSPLSHLGNTAGGRSMTSRARLLEERVTVLAEQLERSEREELERIANEHTVRGQGRSGAVIIARNKARLANVKRLLEERLRLEIDLPLAPEERDSWHGDLVGSVHRIVDRQGGQAMRALEDDWQRMLGAPLPDEIRSDVASELKTLKDDYLLRADTVQLERRQIGMAEKDRRTTIIFNFNQTQVASLNLGQMIGDVTASVEAVNQAVSPDVADALKNLAEAVTNDGTLERDQKADALELVAGFGEELAAQKRAPRLRALAGGIWTVVKGSATLAGAYGALKLAATAAGYPFFP